MIIKRPLKTLLFATLLCLGVTACRAQYTTNAPGLVSGWGTYTTNIPVVRTNLFPYTTNAPQRHFTLAYTTNANVYVVCGADQNNGTYTRSPDTETNTQTGIIYSNLFRYSQPGAQGAMGRAGTWKIFNAVSGFYTEMYLNTNVSGEYTTNPPPTGWTTNADDMFGNLVPPTNVSPQVLITTNYP